MPINEGLKEVHDDILDQTFRPNFKKIYELKKYKICSFRQFFRVNYLVKL